MPYDKNEGEITQTNIDGFFSFISEKREITLVLFARNFNVYEQKFESNRNINIQLRPLSRELMEVEVEILHLLPLKHSQTCISI